MRSKPLLLIIVLISVLTANSHAQNFKSEKRIFIWDVTLSMWGYGDAPNIGEEVRSNLIKAIKNISDEQTEIVVVPFQDGILKTWNEHEWTVFASDQGKNKLIERIESIDPKNLDVTRTNICAGWDKAISLLNPNKRNCFFLLTDGNQNSQKVSDNCVEENILRWCKIAQENDGFAFYVMLTDYAKNDVIERAIKKTCRIESTEGTNVQFVEYFPASKEVYFNLFEPQIKATLKLEFKNKQALPEGFSIEINLNNKYFKLKQNRFEIGNNNQITLELIPQENLSQIQSALGKETRIPMIISNPDFSKIFCINEQLTAVLQNMKERVLTIVPIEE